jgi:arsenate reductase
MLEEEGREFEIVKYLEDLPTKPELKELIKKLGIKPIELVRQKETVWKENYKGKDLNDSEIIDAMLQHPNLIERPIIVNGEKAVVARPAQAMRTIL